MFQFQMILYSFNWLLRVFHFINICCDWFIILSYVLYTIIHFFLLFFVCKNWTIFFAQEPLERLRYSNRAVIHGNHTKIFYMKILILRIVCMMNNGSKSHEGLDFPAQKCHPETCLTFPSQTTSLAVHWLCGINKTQV